MANETPKRESFKLWRSTIRMIRKLPQDLQLETYNIVFAFALDGEHPDENAPIMQNFAVQIVWEACKDLYTNQWNKYRAGSKTGATKARKGNQNAQKTPPAAAQNVTSESDILSDEQRDEYGRFVEWGKNAHPFYFDASNVDIITPLQYTELRTKYPKETLQRAVEDLDGRNDYKTARKYGSAFTAIRAFCEGVK